MAEALREQSKSKRGAMKLALLAIITVSTGYAVVNNLGAISRMGVAPWSGVL